MTKAIRSHVNGGPEVMCFEDIELSPPGPGEIRIRHTAIGVNFSDINVRRGGFYLTGPPRFPMILGNEAAGVVAALGAGVDDVEVGERVPMPASADHSTNRLTLMLRNATFRRRV